MQLYKDNYKCSDENTSFFLSLSSVIGGRDEQQDSAGYELRGDEGLIVICDGTGGHDGGKTASSLAVKTILESYEGTYPCDDIKALFSKTLEDADKKISELKKEDGSPMRGGTTAVIVFVKKQHLFWASVGDSRAYILRDGELVKITEDHIYRAYLDQQLSDKQISMKEYQEESEKKGDRLISFLGIGGIPMINMNDQAFQLKKNDRIMISTDGLYKLVSDEEIARVLDNFSNTDDALGALEQKAQKASRTSPQKRDNMTVALIKIK